MSKYSFGTKAETLEYLYQNRSFFEGNVYESVYFRIEKWINSFEDVINSIHDKFSQSKRLIIRSSAIGEDSSSESMAGKYESIICKNNDRDIIDAVNKVIESYGEYKPDNQVLVQKMAEEVSCSGVVFSLDPNTGGKYFVINYDDNTGSTSSVTSGRGSSTKLYYHFHGSKDGINSPEMAKICSVMRKLMKLTGYDALDMEFLFSKAEMYVLQLRPLIVSETKIDFEKQRDVLTRIQEKIEYENVSKPFLYGKRTVYGVMPDWNPAEMIGIHPRNLAISLYKEIITDEVWAYQRDNYGYKKLRSYPLMVDLCGFPYIDVRVSFNSFIPEELDKNIAEKLVNYYLDQLEESPEKHDKVEFDIVFSCYTFDLTKRIKVLLNYGFSEKEIETIVDSLRKLTRKISDNEMGLWKKDYAKLSILEKRREEILGSNLKLTDKIFWLLEDCKRYGTLPFAGLARAGFIAVQLLKSMVEEGIISEEENEDFMNDLQSVSSSMRSDYSSMSKDDFLNKYGFLRPGTYDICSPRYDEEPDSYFKWNDLHTNYRKQTDKFRLSLSQMERIKDALEEHDMGGDVLGLFSFIKSAIEGREFAKFIFTRNLSDIIKYLTIWGKEKGYNQEELSYMDINILKEIYCGAVDEKLLLEESIEKGKYRYQEGQGIVLPPLLFNSESVVSFHIPESQPTFVTQGRVQGELYGILDHSSQDLDGKIILIEAADPGYDWIFSHDIKGFITKYGGANSHMAIRAGELGLPAVIGVGDRLYNILLNVEIVEIDAPKKQIKVIS